MGTVFRYARIDVLLITFSRSGSWADRRLFGVFRAFFFDGSGFFLVVLRGSASRPVFCVWVPFLSLHEILPQQIWIRGGRHLRRPPGHTFPIRGELYFRDRGRISLCDRCVWGRYGKSRIGPCARERISPCEIGFSYAARSGGVAVALTRFRLMKSGSRAP